MNPESNTTPASAAQPKGKAWYSQSAEEVLTQLVSSASGLSAQEAAKRLEADGPNELKEGKRISPLQIFIGQFKSLIIWILIVAGVISGVLGETVDAVAILAIVVLNAVIGFYQEFSAEKPIAALKNLTAHKRKCDAMGRSFRFLPWVLSQATFSAWIRTGLATPGGGLAVARSCF